MLSRGGGTLKPKTVDQSVLIKADNHQTSPNAKVNIVEFGDYRCPACKQAYPVVQEVLKNYGDKVNFVFRNFAFLPDSVTNSSPIASTLAANAAECANDQNKFMQMHDFLYSNQPPETDIKMYTVDNLTKDAGDLGMDTTKFKACLTNGTHDSVVKTDYADGQVAGVNSTPSFFVNGQQLPGTPTLDGFKAIIDPILSGK